MEEEKVDSDDRFIERTRDAESKLRSERELSSRRLSARKNTRYGADAEDSINFDLTKDQEDLGALESPGRRLKPLSDSENP